MSRALIEAVEYDESDKAAGLLAGGANPNIRNMRGEPMLYVAVANYSIDMVRLLLKHGASALACVHRTSLLGEDYSILELAASTGDMEIMKLIAGAVLDANHGEAREMVLNEAVKCGALDLAEAAIDSGANINNWEALATAIMKRDARMLKFMLEHGADVNMRLSPPQAGHMEMTPLHLAVRFGNADTVKVILEAKPKLDAVDESDKTAYQVAVERNKKEIVALLESFGNFYSKNRTRHVNSAFIPEKITDTNFSSVVGLDDVKAALQRDILYPIRHPELAKDYGVAIEGGITLYGPPGCGKTLIVRALAGESATNIIEARAVDIYDAYVGSEGHNISKLFQKARENSPCIIFIDEVELLGSARRLVLGSQTWMREALTMFLTELDGLQSQNKGVIVIGATNAPWMMDSALKRHGRLGKMLYVPPPDEHMKGEIFRLNLRDAPVEGDIDYASLAKKVGLCNSADIASICKEAVKHGWERTVAAGAKSPVTMADLLACLEVGQSNLIEWYEMAREALLKESDKQLYPELARSISSYDKASASTEQAYR